MWNSLETLDSLWTRLHSLFVPTIIATAILAIVWSFAQFKTRTNVSPVGWRPWRGHVPLLAACAFCAVVTVLLLAVQSRMQSIMQRKLIECIAHDTLSCTVRVGGSPALHHDELIGSLLQIGSLSAHHSHVTEVYLVTIESPRCDKVVLELYRDSNIRDEYWVYWPIIKNWKRFEMGRIRDLRRELLENDVAAEVEKDSDDKTPAASEHDHALPAR